MKIFIVIIKLISHFILSCIISIPFIYYNLTTYDNLSMGGIQLLIVLGAPWFLTFSKWSNEKIWYRVQNTKASGKNTEPIKFENMIILSIIFCALVSFFNVASMESGGIPEIIGGMFFSSLPAIVYLIAKRNDENKSGIIFFTLQNVLGLLSLLGNILL